MPVFLAGLLTKKRDGVKIEEIKVSDDKVEL